MRNLRGEDRVPADPERVEVALHDCNSALTRCTKLPTVISFPAVDHRGAQELTGKNFKRTAFCALILRGVFHSKDFSTGGGVRRCSQTDSSGRVVSSEGC